MSDLYISIFIFIFIVWGIKYPAVAFSGYLWTDIITPNKITYGFLVGQPISKVIAAVAILSVIINFKNLKKPPSITIPILILVYLLWITLTNSWASFPAYSDVKWNVVSKTMMMAFLACFAINTKKDIELMLYVLLGCLTFFMISAGAKSLLGGGGYGARLIVGASNQGMTESSTLAMASVMTIPIIVGLAKLKGFVPIGKGKWIMLLGSVLCIASLIGTTARTGLIALLAYGGFLVKNKKKFFIAIFSGLILLVAISNFAPESWKERMKGLTDPIATMHASTRVMVWRWTWDHAKENPLGGGFRAFFLNRGHLNEYAPEDMQEEMRNKTFAYHNIFFETLGTQGYIGVLIYLFLIITALKASSNASNNLKDEWLSNIGTILNHALKIYIVGGMFIGVAFSPLFYILISLSACISKIENEKKQ